MVFMAFSPGVARNLYENLSVEELEEEYEKIKKHYCFNSKEEQIDYIIKEYLYASKNTNTNSCKIALEELLKEITGKEYKIEPNVFAIDLPDVINFILKPNNDLFWSTTLLNFFQQITWISEDEKKRLLFILVQDKKLFNDFIKEVLQTKNVVETYDKYKEIAEHFYSMNSIIG